MNYKILLIFSRILMAFDIILDKASYVVIGFTLGTDLHGFTCVVILLIIELTRYLLIRKTLRYLITVLDIEFQKLIKKYLDIDK